MWGTCLISNSTGPVGLTRAQCCSTGPRERMISEWAYLWGLHSLTTFQTEQVPTAPDDPTQHTPLKWSDQTPSWVPQEAEQVVECGPLFCLYTTETGLLSRVVVNRNSVSLIETSPLPRSKWLCSLSPHRRCSNGRLGFPPWLCRCGAVLVFFPAATVHLF